MAAPPSIGQTVVIVDPTNPAQQAVVDNTGALKVGIDQTTPGTTNAVVSKDAQIVPAGCYQVSVTSTAQSLATLIGTSLPIGARLVYVQPETGDIRWRDDGSAPTASIGSRIYASTDYPYNGTLAAVQLISVTGATVTANLRFYQ